MFSTNKTVPLNGLCVTAYIEITNQWLIASLCVSLTLFRWTLTKVLHKQLTVLCSTNSLPYRRKLKEIQKLLPAAEGDDKVEYINMLSHWYWISLGYLNEPLPNWLDGFWIAFLVYRYGLIRFNFKVFC